MLKTASKTKLDAPDDIHTTFSEIQSKTAFLPNYSFKTDKETDSAKQLDKESTWPEVNAGTSVSGIVGGAMTLALAALTGLIISIIKKRKGKLLLK